MDAAEATSFPQGLLPDGTASSLVADLEALLEPMVSQRPSLEEELLAAARTYGVIANFRDDQGRSLFVLMLPGLTKELDNLGRLEFQVDDTTKKLACRHLTAAAEVALDLLTASKDAFLSAGVAASLEGQVHEDATSVEELQRDPEARAVALLTLRLYVAFCSTSAEVQDFAFWSRQALESARSIRPLVPHLAARMRAEVARTRAKSAWDDWTDEDVREELGAWRKFA